MENSSDKLQTEAVEVIEAVLGGQRERYRDLVNRHADKVYAVAWSRLGDRHLAEEVVQETFIQGYQRLNQLKDPAKFLSWIVRIARNTAINLGIRHRNELKKRRRWAVEQPTPTEPLKQSDEQDLTTDSPPDVRETEIEAWCMQQEFRDYLKEMKSNKTQKTN